ncbi:MAG: hypothetical protein V9G12_24185 [Microthrixaceae bacterium]
MFGKALQQVAEGFLDVFQLLLERRQVGGLLLFAFEGNLEIAFLLLFAGELLLQRVNVLPPAYADDQGGDQDRARDLDRRRPTADVFKIEIVKSDIFIRVVPRHRLPCRTWPWSA